MGQRIARMRKERGLTQQQLAKKIGVTQTVISSYEIGRLAMSGEMVARLALALNVSSDRILGLNGTQKTESAASVRILRRLGKIASLPAAQKKVVLKTIDVMLRGTANAK